MGLAPRRLHTKAVWRAEGYVTVCGCRHEAEVRFAAADEVEARELAPDALAFGRGRDAAGTVRFLELTELTEILVAAPGRVVTGSWL